MGRHIFMGEDITAMRHGALYFYCGHMRVLLEYVPVSKQSSELYATICEEMDTSFHAFRLVK